jgi:glucose/arabinose dehydrogenase
MVSGMATSGHITRTLIIPPHRPELLVVSHGSNANLDQDSSRPETARAIVKVFNVSSAPLQGYNYVSEGWNAGFGLRNEVGLAFDGNNM